MVAHPCQTVANCALALGLVVLLAGCATPGPPIVVERSPVFTPRPQAYAVKAGDTLYSIGWRFGLDVQGLARANGLRPPYTIYPGQDVRLVVQLQPDRLTKPSVPPPKANLSWRWPTKSRVVRDYGRGNKGIDFLVDSGTAVGASAKGEVVYAGTGLGGFEHLVIIKHDARYLSAYSVNQPLLVSEGQRLSAGQTLANVSDKGRTAQSLHFEIRRDGEPVSPRSLLK